MGYANPAESSILRPDVAEASEYGRTEQRNVVVESVLGNLDLEDRRLIMVFTAKGLPGDSVGRIRAHGERFPEPRG